ncbi:MAG TPA: DUF6790 family protein [Hyphomicrobium sp.]|nr:DUF6790 family protein [Hyphomicrobium sp.]
MYIVGVVVLLFVAPLASIVIEHSLSSPAPDLWMLVGKWATFWAVGVRLFNAGVMQTVRPQFTASSIFGIADPAARAIVREVGFGNLSIGVLGLAILAAPAWTVPAALAGGLYYTLAGFGHLFHGARTSKERFALVSDLTIAAVLAAFLFARAL